VNLPDHRCDVNNWKTSRGIAERRGRSKTITKRRDLKSQYSLIQLLWVPKTSLHGQRHDVFLLGDVHSREPPWCILVAVCRKPLGAQLGFDLVTIRAAVNNRTDTFRDSLELHGCWSRFNDCLEHEVAESILGELL